MAVDGCAPRAKMNQQRARRFRSAKDAQEARDKAVREGKDVSDAGDRFDSNCITPGTPFMVRLQKHLEYFVRRKLSTDPLWKDVRVVLSGNEVPGEGEHKIMDFIRAEKMQPGYNPHTRHCMYGLDADLIVSRPGCRREGLRFAAAFSRGSAGNRLVSAPLLLAL